MRKSILLLLLVILFSFVKAQVIPFGLMMTVSGKLEQVEMLNYRSYIKDTFYIEYQNQYCYGDPENFTTSFLLLIEPPSDYSKTPSNMDPSRRYDTSYVEEIPSIPNQYYISLYNPTASVYYLIDTTIFFQDTLHSSEKPAFQPHYDEWIGLNITDSNLVQIKSILRNYVHQLWGKNDRDDLRWELHQVLSEPDSIEEKIPCFDFILDQVLFYNYQDTFLTSILGYHWDYGVEIDSLRYDKKGNVIYYARETPGVFRHELHFKYDHKKRIISIDKVYLTWLDQNDDDYEESIRENYQFKYNREGKLAEIVVSQKDQEPNIMKVYWKKPRHADLFKTHVSIFTLPL